MESEEVTLAVFVAVKGQRMAAIGHRHIVRVVEQKWKKQNKIHKRFLLEEVKQENGHIDS